MIESLTVMNLDPEGVDEDACEDGHDDALDDPRDDETDDPLLDSGGSMPVARMELAMVPSTISANTSTDVPSSYTLNSRRLFLCAVFSLAIILSVELLILKK